MIQRLDEEGDDFVPRRGIIMMISSDESEDAEYSPKRGIKEEIENAEKPLGEDQSGESETSDSESSPEENESSGYKNDNKKYESSSVSPPAPRSVPSPILRRNNPGKGTMPNPPSEGWHMVYAQQQRRQKELLTTVNERLEMQNSHIQDMNKYLARAKDISDSQDEKDRASGERIQRVEQEQRRNERAYKDYEERTTAWINKREAAYVLLEKEIAALESRKHQRWTQLVADNKWFDYENDSEFMSLETNLDQTREIIRQERMMDSQPRPQPKLHSPSGPTPKPLSAMEAKETKEGSPYHFMLIKMRKGEKKCYVNYLLNEKRGEYEGPFDADLSIHHLIEHKEREEAKSTRGGKIPNVGLAELLDSERKSKKRKAPRVEKQSNTEEKETKYQIGQKIFYFIDDEVGNEKWHTARVMWVEHPGEGSNPLDSGQVLYRISPDYERGQTYVPVSRKEKELRNWDWAKPCLMTRDGNQPLLPLDRVGIDTCSALSVSSRRDAYGTKHLN